MHALILAGVIAASTHHYPITHHAHHSATVRHSVSTHHARTHKPITTTSTHRTHSVHVRIPAIHHSRKH
jgi:hypothetical protein